MIRWKFIVPALALLLLLIIANLTPVLAEGSLQSLAISAIDSSGFPAIKLTLQALDSNNNPITGLTPKSINVSENGQPVDFSIDPYTAGIRVVFLVDSGVGIDYTDMPGGDSRLSEMKSTIKDFLSQMNVSDSVAILVQEGSNTNVINDFSSSVTALQSSLDNYNFNYSQPSSGYNGIFSALSRLKGQTDGKVPFIVFLTSGIQDTRFGKDNVTSELKNQPHPTIHAVLFRGEEGAFGPLLSDLATSGGGHYFLYNKPAIDTLFQSMGVWRNQYLITYRSPNSQSGNRNVVVTTSSNNIPVSATYSVTLQPPQITIQSPNKGSTVTRQAGTTTQGQSGVGTDFTTVKITIDWPDGHPRKITSVSLIVNNQTQGTTSNPNLDSSGVMNIPWDLRSYSLVGQNPVSMQIQVTDELGMTSSSTSMPFIVLVQPNISVPVDICKGLPKFLCTAVTFVLPYTNFIAIGIALVALVLVIVFRRRIVSAGAPMVESVGNFVKSVTKRFSVSTPKAYLEILKGADSDRTIFEIYGKTPIGRSREDVGLLFRENEEDSVISRLHCTILDEDDFLTIRDEDSTHGTYLNGKKLTGLEPVELHDGDLIELAEVERGGIKFKFSLADPSDKISDTNTKSNGDTPIKEESEGEPTKLHRR